MTDNPRLQHLLDELLDSQATPSERGNRGLFAQVRREAVEVGMPDNRVSRREALRCFGGAAAATLLGHFADTAADGPPSEPLIDTHFHLVNPRLPGVPETLPAPDKKTLLAPFDAARNPHGAKQLAKVIQAELKANGIGQVLCMPRHEVSDKDPLGVKEVEALAALVEGPKLHPVGLVHPERFDRDHLALVEDVLKQGKVKALKVYLGYLHYGPYHVGYRPYYKLAAKFQTPVIFHTGDTFSDKAKVKYAHPRAVDEVAVDFPETKFVLAHFGNPWITDAAEVVYKNKNVWADLSGIVIGDADTFATMKKEGVLGRTVKRIKEGIEYTGTPEKFLFGSDWPLAPLAIYLDFVRQMFPEKQHAAVFGGTARALFGL
jgi:predicted TIM-barrel fold metal-dependent hydrolase